MISLEEAQQIILNHVNPLGKIKVSLDEALGGVLAEHMYSPADIPNVDCSMMDGYAVSPPFSSPKWHLRESRVRAGDLNLLSLKKGEAVEIYTGAQLPMGALAVIPKEAAEILHNELCSASVPESGLYVRKKGSDVSHGERLLSAGDYLGSRAIGLLASA